MPIELSQKFEVLSQQQFGEISYEVMRHAFALHREMGRFFDEPVYRSALRSRLGRRAATEATIVVRHGGFEKTFSLDLVVDGGAAFELKTVRQLQDQHRSQLIHQLMLAGLPCGKLVNFLPEQLEHEIVNSTLSLKTRRSFRVRSTLESNGKSNSKSNGKGGGRSGRNGGCKASVERFQETLIGLLRDWGAGLDLQLYEEALTHLLGGPKQVCQSLAVTCDDRPAGRQTMRLIDPTTAFQLTALRRDLPLFESHLRRQLRHVRLERLLWANVTCDELSLGELTC